MALTAFPPPRVLVVEDHQPLASLLCRALAEDGLLATGSLDGAAALQRALAEPFDALLVDIGLPRLSGLEVCASLRDAGYSIPVVILTARDGSEEYLAARQAGASDYFVKPFSIGEVSARLHELVAAHRGRAHGHLIDGSYVAARRYFDRQQSDQRRTR